jgi:S-adenosylmethionine:diacylglycerol 3-amino-3-carboxypropyl transferase
VPAFAKDPKQCEYTICVDVMEHIEYEFLDNVLVHLKEKTKQKAFVCIATEPSKTILPDGRNAHLIQENFVWWYQKFIEFFTVEQVIFRNSSFWLIVS